MDANKIESELKILAKEANKRHQKIRWHLINAFDRAHQCGKFLIQAKTLIKHGQWKQWLRKNISFSYETASDYMRVTRCWNDDCLVAARQDGYVFTSIKSVLDVLREERAKEKAESRDGRTDETSTKPMTKRQKKAAVARYNLKRTFAQHLKSLTIDEVLMYDEIFNELETGWWEKVVYKLHHLVCCKLEYDPYEYESSFDNRCPLLNENKADSTPKCN